jgi:hypothetical protein
MLTAVMHVTIFNAGFAIFALLGRSKDTYPIAKPVRPAFARAMAPSGNHQSRCRVAICIDWQGMMIHASKRANATGKGDHGSVPNSSRARICSRSSSASKGGEPARALNVWMRLQCRFWGQERRSDRAPVTSGLPRQTDIPSVRRHVSKVPKHKVAALQPAAREQEPRGR